MTDVNNLINLMRQKLMRKGLKAMRSLHRVFNVKIDI